MRRLLITLLLLRALAPLTLTLTFPAPAHAAFPTMSCVATSSEDEGTSDVVNLPASIAAGDLVLEFHFKDDNSTYTYPAGWVEIKELHPHADNVSMGVAYRIAAGALTTVTVTTGADESFEAIACRIPAAGWHGTTPPEISTGASGSNTTPDPDTVTPSWGSADNLFIAVEGSDPNAAVSAYPTNYSLYQTPTTNVALTPSGAVAARALAATSDNPGTFTISASDEWVAATVVVRPSAGAGAAARRRAVIF